MKTAAKVFLILGLISIGITVVFTLLMSVCLVVVGTSPDIWNEVGQEQDREIMPLVAVILFVVVAVSVAPGLVFTIMGLKRLCKAQCKADVPAWLSVCVLIFGNLIAGILMLCLSDKDFPAAPAYGQPYAQPGYQAQQEFQWTANPQVGNDNGFYPSQQASAGQQNAFSTGNGNLYGNGSTSSFQPQQTAQPTSAEPVQPAPGGTADGAASDREATNR